MSDDYVIETIEHKKQVARYLRKATDEIFYRAIEHDNSKFSPAERPLYEKLTPILKTLEYGSEEYKQSCRELGPALAHHYACNDHHAEHFQLGINDMNLIQVLEMLCDWMAAIKRVKDGDINKSLEVNKKRFGISDQLYQIIKNTVTNLKDKD